MMTRSRYRQIGKLVSTIVLGLPCALNAQPERLRTNGRVVVYLEPFSLSEKDSRARDLATFTHLTLSYSLARLSRVRIYAAQAPSCLSALTEEVPNTTVRAVALSSTEPDSALGDFFLIRGAIERAVKDTAYLVDIEITHCTTYGMEKVFRRTVPVAENAVADEVSAVADEAVDRVEYHSKLRTLVVAPDDAALRDVLTAALRSSTRLRPVDSLPDLRLELRIPSQQPRVANLTLSGGVPTSRWSVPLSDDRAALPLVAERIATEASNRAELALLGTVSSGPMAATERQKAIVLVRRALCLEQAANCTIAPEAAAAGLSSLRIGMSRDPELFLLAGRTKLASGDYGAAVAAFRTADSLIQVNPSATLSREVNSRVVHRLTGDAFSSAGNFASAAVEYRTVLRDAPADTATVLALIESLRGAGRHVEALGVVRQANAWLHDTPSLDSAAVVVIRGMDARALVEGVSLIRDVCRFKKSLQAECATAYARRGIDLARSHGPEVNVHILLDSAIAYGAKDSLGLDAALALASLAARVIQFPLEKGAVPAVQNYDRRLARTYLRLARGFMSDGTSAQQREWFLRISAITAAADGDFDSAYVTSVDAARAFPTISSALLTVHIAIAAVLAPPGGEHRASTHSSGEWFRVARINLDSSIAKYSRDRTLPRLLLVLCANLLNDYQCSFSAAQILINRGTVAPREVLELVEASVLADKYAAGRDWIGRVRKDSLSSCDRSLAELFTVWGSLQQGDTAAAHKAFVSWTSAIKAMSIARRSNGCWNFSAAQYMLSKPEQPLWSRLISQMIRFTMDATARRPEWLISVSSPPQRQVASARALASIKLPAPSPNVVHRLSYVVQFGASLSLSSSRN
jgi:hypothetical protein